MVARRAAQDRAPLERILSYWHALPRRGCALPWRDDVEPRAIEDLLDQSFLLEWIGPDMARFRVAGGHLSDLVGRDASGVSFSDLFAPRHATRVRRALRDVFAARQGVELTISAPERGFGTVLHGHALLLPLRAEDGHVTRALGCITTLGRIGHDPRRFHIVKSGLIALPASPACVPTSAINEKARPEPRLRLVVSH